MSKRLGAEFLGTLWLVLGGCGSAVLAAAISPGGGIGLLGVSLAFGLTVLTMAFAIGPISGCHLNPAVTFGLAVGGRIPWGDVIPYWVAQALGAIAASAIGFPIPSSPATAITSAVPSGMTGSCAAGALSGRRFAPSASTST